MSVINREDAIAKIKDIPYVQEHPNIGLLFEEWLKSLPDADDGWISVEKRLPEESVNVLTYISGNYYMVNRLIDKEYCEWLHDNAVAWRPLPPAYEPKEDK